MADFLRDIRFSLRQMAKNRGFTAVALLTLAIGIGATTAMFNVVNAVLLRPLPFKDPGRLVLVKERLPKLVPKPVSIEASDVETYVRENRSFDGVAGFIASEFDLTGHGNPQKIAGTRVGWNLFSLLGVDPVMGRTFTTSDDRVGSDVAIVSYSFWKQQLGASPAVIGQTLTLNRKLYVIVGVMPAEFTFPLRADKVPDIYVPMGFTPEELKPGATSFAYGALARLKPGVTMEQAQADVERIAKDIQQNLSAGRRGELQILGTVVPLNEEAVGELKRPLLLLFLAVLFVLLIAIVNVANLMLARGMVRQREIAIRMALGVGARRLVSQLLVESVVLGIIGGMLGILLSLSTTSALIAIVPENMIRLRHLSFNGPMLIFALGVSIVAGLAFGVAPAMFALHTNLNQQLNEGGRGTSVGRRHQRVRGLLAVAQFALAVVLLAGAGLLLRSFQRVLEVDPGFQPDHVVTAALSLPSTEYAETSRVNLFYNQLQARLQRIPDVKAAGLSNDLPLETEREGALTVKGYSTPPGGGLALTAFTFVMGDYFHTMSIPLVEGRSFTQADDANGQKVVIISAMLAKKYFAGRDPIGGQIKLGTAGGSAPWMTVVGVAGDVKAFGLDSPMLPHTYLPFLQRTTAELHGEGAQDLIVSLRTSGNPADAGASMRNAVWSLDREMPVTNMRTMDQLISESTAPRRFNMVLVGSFAGIALVLAGIGLYGVMSYWVSQRSHEIGIRMTVGATREDVLRMVLKSSLRMVLPGVLIGLAGALAASRLLASFLFEVRPSDPLTLIGVALVLALVAVLASMAPAMRATNVDPVIALRNE